MKAKPEQVKVWKQLEYVSRHQHGIELVFLLSVFFSVVSFSSQFSIIFAIMFLVACYATLHPAVSYVIHS